VETDNTIEVVVEVPMGSRNKYELDKERGVFVLDRMLFSAVHYPGDYGFVDHTLAKDGDPLDVVVILGEPTFPGCRILGRILGNLDMEDDAGQDDKLLCVPETDPRWRELQDIDDVPAHLKDEISHFFNVYKDLEHKEVIVRGWQDRATALDVLADARDRYPG
jgi:inorganic pyrophosphatase